MAVSRFSPQKVHEIMHRDVRQIDVDACLTDAAKKMRDMNIGCLPVWQDDKLVGIITDRDVACRAVAKARDPSTTTVGDIMSKDVAFCFEDQSAMEAALIMEKRKVRRLPVLDREKHPAGILTLSDLAKNAPDMAGMVVQAVSLHP
jgi:CBS domain-containing protein